MRQVEFGRSPDNEIKTVTPTSNTSYKFSLEISEEDSIKVTIRNKILRKLNNKLLLTTLTPISTRLPSLSVLFI